MDKSKNIVLRNIKKTYSMGELSVQVLKGMDLEIIQGEITVIIGASGSGKTTLLNILGGIDKPTEGNIYFNDQDITKFSESELTQYRRKHVGFVFQFYNLIPTLTAVENVQVATEISANPMDPIEALRLVGMEDRVNYFPAQLSGGQQQRVSIARAISKNPALILCDEPTGALDTSTGQLILKTLVDVNRKIGATIVIITHNTPISQLAHKVIKIDSGLITHTNCNEKTISPEDIQW